MEEKNNPLKIFKKNLKDHPLIMLIKIILGVLLFFFGIKYIIEGALG